MKLFDLSHHKGNPDYYDRSRDMEIALVWNAIKKTLAEIGQEKLFGYITSVRLSEKYVAITTRKPIVNAELRIFSELLLIRVNAGLKLFGGSPRIGIRFK